MKRPGRSVGTRITALALLALAACATSPSGTLAAPPRLLVDMLGGQFYTALGHRDDVLESDWYGAHLLAGIQWALEN